MKNHLLFLLIAALFSPGFPATGQNKTSSVLATGKWYKLAVTQQGIHRISYSDLVAMNIDPATIQPSMIRIFGNGSGSLPEVNSGTRIDDLRELAIQVNEGGDGHFDPGDEILFYGEAADKWTFERLTRFFSHQRNLYSDTTYYYLNADQLPGRRVIIYPFNQSIPNAFSTRFDQPLSHESDLQNLIRSGREWYGEVFDNITDQRDFSFNFPNIDNTLPVKVRIAMAGKCPSAAYFFLIRNGIKIDSLKVDPTKPQELTVAARPKSKLLSISNPAENFEISLKFALPTSSSSAWLNYLDVTATRHLSFVPSQMSFRDVSTAVPGNRTEFVMTQASGNIRIWDVTDPSNIFDMETQEEGGTRRFRRATDTLREFIAFDGSSFLQPRFCGEVSNQNLHGAEPTSMIIVTHRLFDDQAQRLAAYHRQSGMTVQVVPVDEIFNEFSCGQPDPTAIRDFVRMLWLRAEENNKPRYLLLFGDGSYDPKNRVPGNNNFIPTFQSAESLNTTTTFVTDDYFGIMAPSSGQDANGAIEIGIGRFPVSTTEQATDMVDKIFHYSGTQYPIRSDWRNLITFMADDEDDNLHMHQAEEMIDVVEAHYPGFNINKIYFDAYKMIEIPGGLRFPDANKAVNDVVAKGSLIVNYTGHGGESGWSYEQVITTADILSWKNSDKLPVFVTATCEFSRFDNPERYTAGEMLINQPAGGAIALYSTTRLAFAGMNIQLNTSFFQHLMDKDGEGRYIKMGDLIRLSKNDINNHFQLRNFVLLGDPAQRIAFPEYSVRTLSVKGQEGVQTDTVHALSPVTIKGRIEDINGLKVSSFNGKVTCSIYDKPTIQTTLGNRMKTSDNYPEKFSIRNSLLFKGSVPVKDGEFEVRLVMPRGLSLPYGAGKISYYAWNDANDAAGYSADLIIGGTESSVNPVNDGPEITLALTDPYLLSQSYQGTAPILTAELFDTNGINWLGLGIGHEIVAVIDGDRPHSIVLNDYYQPAFSSFTRGSLTFPLPEMAPGNHFLTLKAWDLFDNSSEKSMAFSIAAPPDLKVTGVRTGPNPLTESTRFYFTTNLSDLEDVRVTIQVFNLSGMQVTSIRSLHAMPLKDSGSGYIDWDGTDQSGKKLPDGLYPYKVIFEGTDGKYYQTSNKLMITR